MRKLLLLLFVCASIGLHAQYTLTTYRINMQSAYLQAMWGNPEADYTYPATLITPTDTLTCDVKFRGGITIWDPKRSWQVKFNNDNNEFGMDKLFLNAEWGDKSLMRDFLTFQLYRHFNYPSSKVEFISLVVNNQYYGVYIQLEPVEEAFLERNGRSSGNLYKASNHGANMAPLTHWEDYPRVWEKKIGDIGDFSDIQRFFNQIYYDSPTLFSQEIQDLVNIDDVLTYFAIEFALVARDNFTKNTFLYDNSDLGTFELFPWDNDGTFGDYAEGVFDPEAYALTDINMLEHQSLFRRLMQTPEWRSVFFDKLAMTTSDGFNYLDSLIDSTYTAIQHDVYLDSMKGCTNAEFDAEIGVLHTFLDQRAGVLDAFDGMNYIPLSEFYASNPYPTPANPVVTFRCRSAAPQNVLVVVIPDLDFDTWGGDHGFFTLPLYDDGGHNDGIAGDLVYGNSYDTSGLAPHLALFSFAGSGDDYPCNGLFYVEYERTASYAFNRLAEPYSPAQPFGIGNIYRSGSDYLVEITNAAATEADLSYCTLEVNGAPSRFLIPEHSIIPAGGAFVVSTNWDLAQALFPSSPSVGEFFYSVPLGSTVRLLSPMLTTLTERVCTSFATINYNGCNIVINEINYNPSSTFNSEDWVELYNPQSYPVSLTGWYFSDSEDNHRYNIPAGTTIPAYGYLVLSRYYSYFHAKFPNTTNVVGDFEFGLNGGGELIRLFNPAGQIADQVTYDDDPPWPIAADGQGYTLALVDPLSDNSLSTSWIASDQIGGTPGIANRVTAPTNLCVSVSGSVLTLSWTPVSGAVSYRVYASATPDGTFTQVSTSATEFSLQDGRMFWTSILSAGDTRKFYLVRSSSASY
jgi:hypothetical protein